MTAIVKNQAIKKFQNQLPNTPERKPEALAGEALREDGAIRIEEQVEPAAAQRVL
ncbi:MAG: hypothetical protein LBC84_06400 [Prevotellaceae bacterium]|jgi:hypothetical protein|nr:hypothetical protein [Prevotellaceae bacterium]